MFYFDAQSQIIRTFEWLLGIHKGKEANLTGSLLDEFNSNYYLLRYNYSIHL